MDRKTAKVLACDGQVDVLLGCGLVCRGDLLSLVKDCLKAAHDGILEPMDLRL